MGKRTIRAALAGVCIAPPIFVAFGIARNAFDEDGPGVEPNYEPLDLPGWLDSSVVVLSAATLVAALFVLVPASLRREIAGRHVRVTVALLLAGLYAAFTYRVATAAVGGANIGAGLLFMLGAILVPALVVYALIEARADRT